MIWAVSEDGWIGKDGKLPWHVPAELKQFKTFTGGGTVVMGRKTWQSLPTQPLVGRRNVVVSTRGSIPGAEVCSNPYWLIAPDADFWVIGGKQLFDFFMPYADELYVSEIPIKVDGDVAEPYIASDQFNLTTALHHEDFTLEYYVRISK